MYLMNHLLLLNSELPAAGVCGFHGYHVASTYGVYTGHDGTAAETRSLQKP